MNLDEEWRDFLRHNPDARLIVDMIMSRTGFGQDDVLFYLLEMWAEQDYTPEQQREPDSSLYAPTTRH